MPYGKLPFVVALTGPIGSGVTTVSKILEGKGFHRVSMAAPIKEELLSKEKKSTLTKVSQFRRKLQDLGDAGRQQSLTKWIEAALSGIEGKSSIVIDGIRNKAEVDFLRDNFTHCFLIAVVADHDTRWQRVQEVYQKNYQEFIRDDERDSVDKDDLPHGQQVGRCVNDADFVFQNVEPLGSSDRIASGIEKQLMPEVDIMRARRSERVPTLDEVHMAEAYTVSSRSMCLKRRVGAVIVDKDGFPISTGFNENPPTMRPCESEFNACFKDDIMHKELESLSHVHCPKCGTKNACLKKPWKCDKCGEDLKKRLYPSRNMEKCTALHGEERAIRSLGGRSAVGGTMFVTTMPCLQCSRYISDARLAKVVYVEAYPVRETIDFLKLNKVELQPFAGFTARSFNIVFRK